MASLTKEAIDRILRDNGYTPAAPAPVEDAAEHLVPPDAISPSLEAMRQAIFRPNSPFESVVGSPSNTNNSVEATADITRRSVDTPSSLESMGVAGEPVNLPPSSAGASVIALVETRNSDGTISETGHKAVVISEDGRIIGLQG